MERPAYATSLVAPFARQLLAADLPGLPPERLERVVPFVLRRVEGLPSPMRLGVLGVAALVRGLMAIPMIGRRVPTVLGDHPLPIVGEYARLVRSLGYAYVFEEWPGTGADGTPDVGPATLPAAVVP